MKHKVNKNQIFAALALALMLSISFAPSAAFAVDTSADPADPAPVAADTTPADDSGVMPLATTSTPKTVAELQELWKEGAAIENKSYNMSAIVKSYNFFTEKVDPSLSLGLINAVKAASPTTDTSTWNTLPTYEVYKKAIALPEYATNDDLKKAVTSYLEIAEIDKKALADLLSSIFPEKAATIKTMGIDDLVGLTETIPDFTKRKALTDALNEAFDATDTKPGDYTDDQRGVIYAKLASAIAAVKSLDSIDATPGTLPETSAPTPTKPTPTTKTPDTGIFGEGENTTALAAVGGVVALGGIAGAFAVRKTMKSKNHKTRKF